MKRAAFIVSDCGQGHRVRCGALADELRTRGWHCVMLAQGEVWAGDVVVVDHPEAGHVHIGVGKVVRVVDLPTAETADLLIQGWELLRPEFRRLHDLADRCWLHLSLRPGEVVDLRQISGWSEKTLAGRLFDAVASGDVAITYGGMRANECACVGTPMVIIPRNEGERLNAQRLVRAGAAVVAEEDEAESMARSLLDSPAVLRAMSHAGREAVDGLGVKRAADAIEALVT